MTSLTKDKRKDKPDIVAHGKAMERGARDKTAVPALPHFTISPALGGGVRFEHRENPQAHPHQAHEFGPTEHDAFLAHVKEHTTQHFAAASGEEAQAQKEKAEIKEKNLGVET